MSLGEQLYVAAKSGDVEAVERLLVEGANIEYVGSVGDTPLIIASSNGHSEVVDKLLDKGANIEATDKNGDTPLHYAASSDQIKVVKILIMRGSDSTVKNIYRKTPADLTNREDIKNLIEMPLLFIILSEDEKELKLFLNSCIPNRLSKKEFDSILEVFNNQSYKNKELFLKCIECLIDYSLMDKGERWIQFGSWLLLFSCLLDKVDKVMKSILRWPGNLSSAIEKINKYPHFQEACHNDSTSLLTLLSPIFNNYYSKSVLTLHICGNECVGKSQTVKSLINTFGLSFLFKPSTTKENMEIPLDTGRTIGMETHDPIFFIENYRTFEIRINDYGGQEVFHTNHTSFLKIKESIYIIVLPLYDIRNAINNGVQTIIRMFQHWIGWIITLYENNSPHILIILNFFKLSEQNITGYSENVIEVLRPIIYSFKDQVNFISKEPIVLDSIYPRQIYDQLWPLLRESISTISLQSNTSIPLLNDFLVYKKEKKWPYIIHSEAMTEKIKEFLLQSKVKSHLLKVTEINPKVLQYACLMLIDMLISNKYVLTLQLSIQEVFIVDVNTFTSKVLGSLFNPFNSKLAVDADLRGNQLLKDYCLSNDTIQSRIKDTVSSGDVENIDLSHLLCEMGLCIPVTINADNDKMGYISAVGLSSEAQSTKYCFPAFASTPMNGWIPMKGAHHKIARQFKLSNRFAIFTPGLFHRIYIHLGIKYTGCHVSFWKDGFELKVAIPQIDDILGYDLQIIFQCFHEMKFFNVYINSKNTMKGSSILFDTMKSIKSIIYSYFHSNEATTNNGIYLELVEYGLHPEYNEFQPKLITDIEKEYRQSDIHLHSNNNALYFGMELYNSNGIFQSYQVIEIMNVLKSIETKHDSSLERHDIMIAKQDDLLIKQDEMVSNLDDMISNEVGVMSVLKSIETKQDISAENMITNHLEIVTKQDELISNQQEMMIKQDEMMNKIRLNTIQISSSLESYTTFLQQTIYQAVDVVIPTTFILFPKKVTKQMMEAKSLTNNNNHNINNSNNNISDSISNSDNSENINNDNEVKTYYQQLSELTNLTDIYSNFTGYKEIYFYLVDELTGQPFLPDENDSVYPIKISNYEGFIDTYSPIVVTGIQTISSLTKLSGIALATSIIAYFGFTLPSIALATATTYTSVVESIIPPTTNSTEINDMITSSSTISTDESILLNNNTRIIEQNKISLQKLKQFYIQNDPTSTFCNFRRISDRKGRCLWVSEETYKELFESKQINTDNDNDNSVLEEEINSIKGDNINTVETNNDNDFIDDYYDNKEKIFNSNQIFSLPEQNMSSEDPMMTMTMTNASTAAGLTILSSHSISSTINNDQSNDVDQLTTVTDDIKEELTLSTNIERNNVVIHQQQLQVINAAAASPADSTITKIESSSDPSRTITIELSLIENLSLTASIITENNHHAPSSNDNCNNNNINNSIIIINNNDENSQQPPPMLTTGITSTSRTIESSSSDPSRTIESSSSDPSRTIESSTIPTNDDIVEETSEGNSCSNLFSCLPS